jgi:hypothetical protein
LSRAFLAKNTSEGVHVSENSRAVLYDLEVADSVAAKPTTDGQGILLESGGYLGGARIKIERGFYGGVDASDLTTTASISDLAISGVSSLAGAIDDSGMGIVLGSGCMFRARCVLLDTNRSYGLLVRGSARASIDDLTVRGTLPAEGRNGVYGRGIGVRDGSSLAARKVLVYGTMGASFSTIDGLGREINTATISDADLGHAMARQCSGTGCPDSSDAIGLHVSPLSTLNLERFSISDAARAGIVIESGATVQLGEGLVASSSVGLSLPSSLTLSGSTEDVMFQSNAINAELPAPPPIMHP